MKRTIGIVLTAVGITFGLVFLTTSQARTREKEKKAPTFKLVWSEYPSWAVFAVASDLGLINGKKGEMGPLEKKWGVDIELEQLDYDSSINAYHAGKCDAVCVTNVDVLAPALARNSVAILPTSTSYGGDACLVTDAIKDADALKEHHVYGLKNSVSEYLFARGLQMLGKTDTDYKFTQLEPDDAARAMREKSKEIQAIVVWNPLVLQTLKSRPDVRVLFDSTKIPEEIIDLVVVGEDSLKKEGGREFACCVIDCYYAINKRLAEEKEQGKILKALGEKFSNLDMEAMEKVVSQSPFYKTPEEALNLLEGDGTLSKKKFPEIMKTVTDFSLSRKYINKAPAIAYVSADKDAAKVELRFDCSSIRMVRDRK